MRRTGSAVALLAVLGLAAAVGLWRLARGGGESGRPARGDARAESLVDPAHAPAEPELASDRGPSVTAPEPDREPVSAGRALVGRLRLEDLGRLSDARVFAGDRTALTDRRRSELGPSHWEAILDELRSARPGGDGHISFDVLEAAGPTSDALVYVMETGHGPSFIEAVAGTPFELEAEESEPIRVRLRGGDEVTVYVVHRFQPAVEGDAHEEPMIALPSRWTAGAGESIDIPRGGDSLDVWAVSGELRSAVWSGSPDGVQEIVLELQPTFAAGGRLVEPESLDLETADLRVTASRGGVSERSLLGTTAVAGDWTWELARLPTDETTPVTFRLDGKRVVPREKTFPPARAGSRLEVRFELLQPRPLVVSLVDSEERPIPGAELCAVWGSEPFVRSSPFVTDDEGFGELLEAPLGEVWIDVDSEGFAGGRFGPYLRREDREEIVLIILGRAGRIAGRCVRAGEPVTSFQIRYWKGRPLIVNEILVRDREDGSFLIEDAPLGTVQLLASTDDCPVSPLRSVEVRSEVEARIELELPGPGTALGRVADAATGAPIADAEVRVRTAASADETWPWGEPIPVNALGEFRGVPVADPLTMLEIGAPGYASVTRRAHAGPGEVFDCRVVELPRSQELTVQLVGVEEEELGGYSVVVEGSGQEPATFDENGMVVIPGVSPGDTFLTLHVPSGGVTYLFARLFEGEEWRIEIDEATGYELTVEVLPSGDEPLEAGIWVGAAYVTSSRGQVQSFRAVDGTGQARFRGIPPGPVTVDVLDAGFSQLARRVGTVEPVGSTLLTVRLGSETFRIRLLDSDGNSMPSTQALVDHVGSTVNFAYTAMTDANGVATLVGFQPGTVLVSLNLPNANATDIPVELRAASQTPIDVVVDTTGFFDLVLMDQGQPLSGVWVQLASLTTGQVFITSLSDASGRVDFYALRPSLYALIVDTPGFWPTRIEVEARHDRPRFEMQVPTVGSLRVSITSAGRAAGGASVELASTDFGGSVAEWVAAGKVQCSSASLATDAGGELLFHGLPRGWYVWRVAASGSQGSGGKIQVAPRDLTELRVDLP